MHAMVFIHKFCINCLITIQYKDITTLPTTGAINTFEILSILIRLSIVTISIIMIIKDEKAVVAAAPFAPNSGIINTLAIIFTIVDIQHIIINFFSFPEGNNTTFPKKLPPTKLNRNEIINICNVLVPCTYPFPAMIKIASFANTVAPA